ncbi:MAG: acetyl-CoA C-acetyltransferase, partial [Acidimicrobiaceae bacterium]|nr:acetyl-CoA C-acetyltransferase [Acidimicrobiaceae bacterium]
MGAVGATPIVAVAAVARTAVRPVDGELAGWNPVELAGVVGREVLERAGLDAGVLDEVVVGCADPVGACGADAARAIVLAAGWPVGVGGLVVDRAETSGLAAVQAAAAAIRSGQARTVLVVGLGLCSVVPPGAAALNRTYGAPWGGVA